MLSDVFLPLLTAFLSVCPTFSSPLSLFLQRNVFIECSTQLPELRARPGVEGVICKTTPVLGTHAVFNQQFIFTPLISMDGFLTIDVKEKPTFEEGFSLGKIKILLSTLKNSELVVVPIANKKSEKIFVTYVAEIFPL